MAGITLAQAQTQLDAWLAASTAVSGAQSYEIGDRKLTRADARDIRENIDYWQSKVSQLSTQAAGRGRSRTVIVR